MGQRPAEIPEEVLKRLYIEEKLSQSEIAHRLGCSLAAIQRRMKKHGISSRSKSDANFLRYQSQRYHYELWRLQVSSKSSLLNLFERIGPYLKHRKRIQDMQAAIQSVKDRNSGKPPRTLRKMNHAKNEQH